MKIIGWIYALLVIGAFATALLVNFNLGVRLLRTFLLSDISIGLWQSAGYPLSGATSMATAIGIFSTFNCWLFVFYLADAWAPARRLVKQYFTPRTSNRLIQAMKKWGCGWYRYSAPFP